MSKLAKIEKGIAKGKDTDLIKLLGDKDQEVRIAVIDGLEQIGKEDACNVLITLLDDESPKVRGAVARALGMLGRRSYSNTFELSEREGNGRGGAERAPRGPGQD